MRPLWDHNSRWRATVAVARAGSAVLPLDSDNQAGPATTLKDAIDSCDAYVVQVSELIAVWDVDDAAVLARLPGFLDAIRQHGFRPGVFASGVPGHVHPFVRCVDGAQRRRVEYLGHQMLGLKARRAIRPPLSPHRFGLPVGPLGATVADALDALDASPPNDGDDGLPDPPAPPPPASFSSLYSDTKYASEALRRACQRAGSAAEGTRNNVLFAQAVTCGGFIGSGELDEDIARGALLEAGRTAGLSAKECWGIVRNGLAYGIKRPLHWPGHDQIWRTAVAVESRPWPGKQGETDYRVLVALTITAVKAMTDRPAASLMHLVELTGRGKVAVLESLKRLSEDGWIRCDGTNDKHTRIWQLGVPRDAIEPVQAHPPGLLEELLIRGGTADPTLDVWRPGCMGGAFLAYRRLYLRPMTTAELAQSTGRAVKTVRSDLKRLREAGLSFHHVDGRWYPDDRADPNAIAARSGTLGRGATQRRTHEAERERGRQRLMAEIPFVIRPKGSRWAGGQVGLGMSLAEAVAYAEAHNLEVSVDFNAGGADHTHNHARSSRCRSDEPRNCGAERNVAGQIVARVGTAPAHLLASTRALRVVVDAQPTTGDVTALVPADAGRDYVSALLAGDRRGAMAAAPLVPDPYQALQRLHWRLLDLWTLAELRPPTAGRSLRDVAEVTGLPRWTLEELVPLAARYPRAKVGDRLEALAVAHVGLRQAPDLSGQVLTTLAAMWTSCR